MSASPTHRPIAVICAIEAELAHLRAALPPGHEAWRGNRRAWVTELDGHPIVLTLSGINMVSAGAVAEAVISQYQPLAILNYGCAGAHRLDLLPGDIVIGARVVAYDNLREQPDGSTEFIGMRYLHRGEQMKAPFLPADPHLLERAQQIAHQLEGQHEPWPVAIGWPGHVEHRSPRLIVGTVASADRWNRAPSTIEAISRQHGSDCEDMEAGAIALVCATHDVPFLSIKDISNNELLLATESGRSAIMLAEAEIGRRAAALVLALLRDLATSTPPLSRADS